MASKNSGSIPYCMWRSALLVTLQSFSLGYVYTCLNSCLVTGDKNSASDCYNKVDSSCPKGTIYNDLSLSTAEAQVATALTIVGAWLGCLLGSIPAEVYGRKTAVLGNNIFFIVGAAIAASGNVYLLFIGRLISGLGVGASSVVPPVLLSEIATAETRGTITTLHQAVLTLAIFVASVLGYGMVTYVEHGWQYIQAFGAVPGVLMLLLHSFVPESPKWLLGRSMARRRAPTSSGLDVEARNSLAGAAGSTGDADGSDRDSKPASSSDFSMSRPSLSALASSDHEEVVAVLRMLRPEENFHFNVDKEILAILEDAKRDAAISEDAPTWKEVFASRKAVVIGCGLMFFQAITGVNSVFFYSTTIFGLAGFSQSIIGTAIVGVVNFLTTLVSTYIIDKFGRKVLLTAGTYLMLASLAVLSSVLLSDSVDQGIQGTVAVCAVVSFVIGFAFGLGAVCWVIMSEIMPTRLRSKAMGLFLSINWAANLLIGFLTLTAIDGLGGVRGDMSDDETAAAEKKGVAYVYFIFAGFTALAIAFIHLYVPETQGKSLEELEGNGDQITVYTQLIPDTATTDSRS